MHPQTMTESTNQYQLCRHAIKNALMGIDDELEKMGAKEGDIVKILDFDFEYRK